MYRKYWHANFTMNESPFFIDIDIESRYPKIG